MKKRICFIGLALLLAFGFLPSAAKAYRVEDMKMSGEAPGDFVLGPGKSEMLMNPGETATKQLYISNRLGEKMKFKIEIEDFTGSSDPEKTVVLLGEKKGPYSLKDYINPELTEFVLEHGERMVMSVDISIPEDAEPGGRYGAVLVKSMPSGPGLEEEEGKAVSGIKLISRLGTLFFVRVKGDVNEEGFLSDFKTKKNFYENGPVPFELLFQNEGSIHLTPFGVIEIRNLLGKKIEEIKLDAWFAMPGSLRSRKVEWERDLLFGRYTATAKINRGYGDAIDEKTVTFWVFPWKLALAGLIALILIIWFLKWIFGHFEIRRKPSKKSEQKTFEREPLE